MRRLPAELDPMDAISPIHSPRRAGLLARLAAERAHLFGLFEGLDEATLSHTPVVGGWTATALLAHLAYWDAFHTDRLAKLAEGRQRDIEPLGDGALDARNTAHLAHLDGLSFPEAVGIAQKERRTLLTTLARLDDALLLGRVRLSGGWRASPYTWVRWRHEHDADHAAEIARWRRGFPANDPSLRVIHRSLLRPLLGLARRELLALAALVPPAERETRPLTGAWTLKQIAGHLSDYERMGVLALRALAAGREPVYETRIENFDTFNEARGAFWAAATWDEAWATLIATRRALLHLIETLPDEALTRPIPAPWFATTTACGYLLDMAQHEREHAGSLRRTFDLPILPRRLTPGG